MKRKLIIIILVCGFLVTSLYLIIKLKKDINNKIPFDVWFDQEVVETKKVVRSLSLSNDEDTIYYVKLKNNTYDYIYEMKAEFTFKVPHKLCIVNLSTDESVDVLITEDNKRGRISDYCQYQEGDVLHFTVETVKESSVIGGFPLSVLEGIVIVGKCE